MFPESGTVVTNDFLPDVGLRKKLIGNYVLYYLADCQKEIIFIVRIVYGRRNMDEILRKLNL